MVVDSEAWGDGVLNPLQWGSAGSGPVSGAVESMDVSG